jgi:hypothetical protein
MEKRVFSGVLVGVIIVALLAVIGWLGYSLMQEKQTNQDCYYCGRPDKNRAHNGGYAARYKATAGFQKLPETEITLSEGALTQNAGWTDSSSDYIDWNN